MRLRPHQGDHARVDTVHTRTRTHAHTHIYPSVYNADAQPGLLNTLNSRSIVDLPLSHSATCSARHSFTFTYAMETGMDTGVDTEETERMKHKHKTIYSLMIISCWKKLQAWRGQGPTPKSPVCPHTNNLLLLLHFALMDSVNKCRSRRSESWSTRPCLRWRARVRERSTDLFWLAGVRNNLRLLSRNLKDDFRPFFRCCPHWSFMLLLQKEAVAVQSCTYSDLNGGQVGQVKLAPTRKFGTLQMSLAGTVR